MTARGPSLAELVDLELRLQNDRLLPENQLEARERQHAPASGPAETAPLLRAWLDSVYAGERRAGTGVEQGLKIAGRWLVGLGLCLGGAATAALLRYDRTTPIDVAALLGALVGVQLIILVALLIHLRPRRRKAEAVMLRPGAVQTWLLSLVFDRALVKSGESRGASARLMSEGLATPLGSVLTWRLVALTQGFGVAFNLGALATLFALVSFTDLAFSWSTTLRLTPPIVQGLTDTLSWPFAWLWPEAQPTLALIERTQHYRLAPALVDPGAAGGWWPFVLACIAFYGLLPRALMLALAMGRWRSLLARSLRQPGTDVKRLLRRLGGGAAGALAAAGGDINAAATRDGFLLTSGDLTDGPAQAAGVVLWRDLPATDEAASAFVAAELGGSVLWVARAGGLAGDLDAASCGLRLAGPPAVRALAVVVDQFENLDKALLRFIAGLRLAPAGRELLVLVLPARADTGGGLAPPDDLAKLAAWRTSVARTADRRLGLHWQGEPS